MKIVIFGSGISGLTVAHELIEKGFEVEVYEKDKIPGGMARTFRDKMDVPTEHSWRGYGPFYYNTFEIMKRIPIFENFTNSNLSVEEIEKHNSPNDLWTIYKGEVYDISHFVSKHPGGRTILNSAGKDIEKAWENFGVSWHGTNKNIIKLIQKNKVGKLKENFDNELTVFDNLNKNRLYFDFLYNERKGRGDVKLSISDIFFLVFLFGKVALSNLRKEEYFKVKLDPIIKKNLSKEGYHFISDFLAGPGYGFDKNTMSLGHYAIFVEYSLYNQNQRWQVMNKPTSEAWINPWVSYLKNKGVKFFFNHELVSLSYNNSNIKKCKVKFNNKNKIIVGEDYVIAINPFNLQKVFEESKIDKLSEKLLKGNIINNQISFRLGFNKKINFDKNYAGYVLIDSPYNITFYPQEDHWTKDTSLGMDGKIKSLISGTIIRPYIKGSLFKKSASNLSIENLKEEIIYQMFESKDFQKFLKKSGVNKENIIYKEVFDDWFSDNGYLKSKNKKWVNNFINEEFRLENKTDFKNLFLAGSHCKTSIYIWSMEGSVESGKLASNLILSKYGKENCKVYTHRSHFIVNTLTFVDDLFYIVGMPNLSVEILLTALIYLFYLFFKSIQA
tara:strand:+ start:66 stop:1904 length:1839 start_codon:yes stop_codon:yes gene_type:complete